jgi:hypothetical protein
VTGAVGIRDWSKVDRIGERGRRVTSREADAREADTREADAREADAREAGGSSPRHQIPIRHCPWH